jgi:hypothetical protein
VELINPESREMLFSEFAHTLRCQVAERGPFLFHIAETRTLHLRSGSAESFATYLVHVNEAKCSGERGIPSAPLCRNWICALTFPKTAFKPNVGQRSLRDRAFRQDSNLR